MAKVIKALKYHKVKTCEFCGSIILKKDEFCKVCGSSVSDKNVSQLKL